MARFTYGDQTVEIPKFKLREIKAASPFIDRINADQQRLRASLAGLSPEEQKIKIVADGGGLTSMAAMMDNLVRVLAVGVLHANKERPYSVASIEAQAELIDAEIGMDELDSLNTAFEEITAEAGLRPKDPPKPKADEEAPAALGTASTE